MLLKDKLLLTLVLTISAALSACSEPESPENLPASNANLDLAGVTAEIMSCENADQNGMALFGDVHIHTRYSFDAAANSGLPVRDIDLSKIDIGISSYESPKNWSSEHILLFKNLRNILNPLS